MFVNAHQYDPNCFENKRTSIAVHCTRISLLRIGSKTSNALREKASLIKPIKKKERKEVKRNKKKKEIDIIRERKENGGVRDLIIDRANLHGESNFLISPPRDSLIAAIFHSNPSRDRRSSPLSFPSSSSSSRDRADKAQ